jgi:hypothetical protein
MKATKNETTDLRTMYGERSGDARRSGTITVVPLRSTV